MQTAVAANLGLWAQDVTGQKNVKVSEVPRDTTVRELVQGLLGKMGLMRRDVEGRPLEYRARLEREGRHLHDYELVDDALQSDDRIEDDQCRSDSEGQDSRKKGHRCCLLQDDRSAGDREGEEHVHGSGLLLIRRCGHTEANGERQDACVSVIKEGLRPSRLASPVRVRRCR